MGTQMSLSLSVFLYDPFVCIFLAIWELLGKSEKGRKSGNRVVIILPGVPGWTFIHDFNHWSVLENLGLATEQTEHPCVFENQQWPGSGQQVRVCRDV